MALLNSALYLQRSILLFGIRESEQGSDLYGSFHMFQLSPFISVPSNTTITRSSGLMLARLFGSYINNPQSQHNLSKLKYPPHFNSQIHRDRCLAQLRSKGTGLERYIYLNGLKDREPDLFYELLLTNMTVCLYWMNVWGSV